ncbi:hypothetical protein [uncultured Oscillibacter sp.]|uniref:hypothetical protein n=1 Tax=uncultured Oscillibacter sp. TaxID=876091 RepID=UPI0026024B4E|nr:hypothetical protein [uncultured Oscillibacter sp.]
MKKTKKETVSKADLFEVLDKMESLQSISLKGQLHSGYEPRPTDLHDLEILHRLEEEGRGKNRHMG